MTIIHKVTHEGKLHSHHLSNLQADCGVIIEHVSFVSRPLTDDQEVCTDSR